MEIVILLIAVFLLSRIKNKNDEKYLRVVTGSILGIAFFFIWPYVHYYTQLLSWSDTYIYTAYLLLISSAMVIVLLLAYFQINRYISAFSFFLFLLIWSISFSYNIEIKDKLAEKTNYFSSQLVASDKDESIDGKEITSPANAYTVTIPTHWKEQKHKVTGLPFYKSQIYNGATIEFRPKCYNSRMLSMSEIVEGISSMLNGNKLTSYQCYYWKNDGYACKISIHDNISGYKRIRWLGANTSTKRLLELDFLIQNSNPHDMKVIDSIFSSVRFNKLFIPAMNCVYSTDWF